MNLTSANSKYQISVWEWEKELRTIFIENKKEFQQKQKSLTGSFETLSQLFELVNLQANSYKSNF